VILRGSPAGDRYKHIGYQLIFDLFLFPLFFYVKKKLSSFNTHFKFIFKNIHNLLFADLNINFSKSQNIFFSNIVMPKNVKLLILVFCDLFYFIYFFLFIDICW